MCQIFQRLTVILPEIIFLYAIYSFFCLCKKDEKISLAHQLAQIALTFFQVGFIFVDSTSFSFFLYSSLDIHFQYNASMQGICILSIVYAIRVFLTFFHEFGFL